MGGWPCVRGTSSLCRAKKGLLGAAADLEVDWEAESGPADDGRTVYTLLSRPLPPYALEHFFSRHGKVPEPAASTGHRALILPGFFCRASASVASAPTFTHLLAIERLANLVHICGSKVSR